MEDFQSLQKGRSSSAVRSKSKLISMKVPEDLLETFKKRAEQQGVPYQTLIKQLMLKWLAG